jgi:Protein of unknown function (DUF3572)
MKNTASAGLNKGGQKTGAAQGDLALAALGWILAEPDRAARFLALTGISPDDLRDMLGSSALDQAVVDHLRAHEPDLIACAAAIGVAPAQLAA